MVVAHVLTQNIAAGKRFQKMLSTGLREADQLEEDSEWLMLIGVCRGLL